MSTKGQVSHEQAVLELLEQAKGNCREVTTPDPLRH